MELGYPLGDPSQFWLCTAKLTQDAVVFTIRADTRVLVSSSMQLYATVADQFGYLGKLLLRNIQGVTFLCLFTWCSCRASTEAILSIFCTCRLLHGEFVLVISLTSFCHSEKKINIPSSQHCSSCSFSLRDSRPMKSCSLLRQKQNFPIKDSIIMYQILAL